MLRVLCNKHMHESEYEPLESVYHYKDVNYTLTRVSTVYMGNKAYRQYFTWSPISCATDAGTAARSRSRRG